MLSTVYLLCFFKFFLGDREFVSSHCPHSLRFAACQLLKEITSFLRESHALLIVSDNDSPAPYHRELSQSSSSRRQKHSIASVLSKRINEVKRKKSSVHILGSTYSNSEVVNNSPNSSPSPSRHAVLRQKSTGNLLRGKSPKAGRYSRQTSKTVAEDTTNYEAALKLDLEETSDLPWLDTIIEMNRSINCLCVHSTPKCPHNCPIEQINTCNMLFHALKFLYDPSRLEQDELDKMNMEHPFRTDPVHEYLTKQVHFSFIKKKSLIG